MHVNYAYILLSILYSQARCIRIGTIYNVSLVGQIVSQMNVTSCDECLCRLAKNITFISFNCHLLSKSCEMFGAYNETISYRLINNLNSSFSFIQLPASILITTAVTTPIQTTTTTTTGSAYRYDGIL